jgi:plastocyanin
MIRTSAFCVAALVLAACGAQSTTAGNGTYTLPGMPDLALKATLPDGTQWKPAAGTGAISEELPGEGLGTVSDSYWKATLGGFTQEKYSQALGFPPKTKITLTNISGSISHTLDVVAKISGPPADFPQSPNLSISAQGAGKLKKGFASGVISPGKSVTFTLAKAGIYLIGCAFHYGEGMRDVLVVKPKATPGPEATPPAR